MARTKFRVEVLTPEGEAFNDEVEQVSTRTTIGSLGLLARHQPVLAMLEPTELRLYSGESDVVRFAQGEGFLQVSDEGTLILVDEVFPVDDLDASDLKDRLRTAEEALERAEEDSEEARQAAREKRRYEAFVRIAISGAWFARMPMEPVDVRVESISTSSLKTSPSGVSTSTGNFWCAIRLG